LTVDGDAYCWGSNVEGVLGDNSPEENIRPSPGLVSGGLKFTALSVAAVHNCALTNAGDAYCWGGGHGGSLGDGTSETRFAPVPVAGGLTFKAVGTGGHSCGITTADVAYCWGFNGQGQIGDGTTTSRLTPIPVEVGGMSSQSALQRVTPVGVSFD
jgi:alpha-tubulin suppressor-like RCC1 family protein